MTPRLRFWLVVAALALFGRMFQTHVLWAEESLPLAAAQQMLAGHTLYRDIWFDKPPGLVWFYAGVMELAGHGGYGLRLIGSLYVFLIALTGYGVARRLAGESAGRWSAFFLAFFLTFYIHSAVVPLAADLLMVLPHLATFYFLAAGWPLAAGAAAGVAFQFNSKAVLVLIAAAGWEVLGKSAGTRKVGPRGADASAEEAQRSREEAEPKETAVERGAWDGAWEGAWGWPWKSCAWSLVKLLAGFGMVAAAGLAVVGASGAWS
jgi:4-amino-4-deoxy-L-arabinose transferase-like glycosyltransferase